MKDPESARWIKRVVKWMDACEGKIPEPAFMKGDLPEWVQRVARELISTLYPSAKLKVGHAWTAGEVGSFLGQRLSYLHAAAEYNANVRISKKQSKGVDRKAVKQMKKKIEAYFRSFEVALGRSLTLASKQPYNEAKSFFAAFAKGLSKFPSDAQASNFHRTTTRVYWLLLLSWRSVEKLTSVRELHKGLCRYLDPHVVGDIKRVEKMCQRLGLSFGPRGRPRR